MTWFLKSIDFDYWKVIQNRYNIPTKFKMRCPFQSQSMSEMSKKRKMCN